MKGWVFFGGPEFGSVKERGLYINIRKGEKRRGQGERVIL